MPTATEHWHLDKKVPIALIFAILIQTAGAFWWASDISTRVAIIEKRQDDSETLAERVVRLEEQMKAQTVILKEIRDHLRAHR